MHHLILHSNLLLAFAAISLGACSPDSAGRASGDRGANGFVFKSISAREAHEDADRHYAVYIPRDYDPAKPTPTIMFLHGSGESGTDGQKPLAVGIGPAAMFRRSEWPFIIIFPQKPDQKSQWVDHEAMVLAILEATRREYNIDANRTYLTGLSQGGAGTWAIGSRHPELWAALAPICGYAKEQITPDTIAAGASGLPIWSFHGMKDDVVPPSGTEKIVAAIQERQKSAPIADPIKAEWIPDANHNSWDDAYGNYDLGKWFLAHAKH